MRRGMPKRDNKLIERDAKRGWKPRVIGIFLLPDFPLMAYASIVEPLRGANRYAGIELYQIVNISIDGGPVQASSGTTILSDHPVGVREGLDVLVVCAGGNAATFDHPATFAWLRALARQKMSLGSVSVGTFVLARAGLLRDNRCTIHWEYIESLREEFPDLNVSRNLFEVDVNRFSCAGGTSALDMMCALISNEFGQQLSTAVRDWFLHTTVRSGEQAQRTSLRERLGVTHSGLLRVVSRIEESLDAPASRQKLAVLAGVSTRQLDRLFKHYLGVGVPEYYLRLRLERARNLLAQTPLSVTEISLACGFASTSHFSRCYKSRFGGPPNSERKKAAEARVNLAGKRSG